MAFNYQAAKQSGYSDDEINKFLAGGNQQQTKPGGFNLTDLLPLIGGVVGGVGGGALGSVVPGAGTAVGGIGGGAAGSALGEFLRQKLTGQNDPNNIAKEGALGLVGGVGGEALGVGGRLLGKLAPTVGETATRGGASLAGKNLAQSFTVPAKLAAELNVPGAADQIIAHGKIPLSLNQAKQLAQTVTGENGLLSTPIRAATTKIKTPINFESTLTDARNQLLQAGLDPTQIATTMKQLDSHFAPYSGKNAKRYYSQPGFMAGEDAWSVMKNLEKTGYGMIHKGANELSPNYILEEQGKALVGVADTLQMQIDKAAQGEGLFPKIKSEILASLDNNPKVGRDLYKAVAQTQNIDELRAIQSPYVRLSRAADITTNRSMAPMTQAGMGFQTSLGGAGLGFGLGGIPGAVMGAAAAPAAQGIAQATRMPLAAGGAAVMNAVGKAAQKGTAGIIPQVAGQGAARAGAAMLTPSAVQGASGGADMPMEGQVLDQGGSSSQSQMSGLSPQAAAMLMAKYPKQAAIIKSIFDVSQTGQSPKKQSAQQIQVQTLAKSGLRNFHTVVDELNADPSVTTKQLIPGQYLSRQFDSALFRTVEALLRIRTGAAAPEQEVRRYMAQWGPRFGDDKKTVTTKLKALETDLMDAYDLAAQGGSQESTTAIPSGTSLDSGLGL